MSCRALPELMSLRLDGRLGPPDALRLEDHLQTCPTCAAQWTALREADSLLRLSARRPVAPPVDFQARVMLRVAATPVARPQLWERERLRIQGGRPTVKLRLTAPISGARVPAPLGFTALPPPAPAPTGFLQQFHPLRNARMGVYLGGMALAGALSALVLIVFVALWATGGAALPAPVADSLALGGQTDGIRAWVTTFWSLLQGILGQIDPLFAAGATVLVTLLGLAWWRIVIAFARRTGDREVMA